MVYEIQPQEPRQTGGDLRNAVRRRVKWAEYCKLALSRRPLERMSAPRHEFAPLLDRESGTIYVLDGASGPRIAN